jgi:DNA-binding ferritin-like protein (Dps family)
MSALIGVLYVVRVSVSMGDIMKKKCSACGKSKTLECFHIKKDSSFGRNHKCKDCRKISSHKYYLENKDRLNKQHKEYNYSHRQQQAKIFRDKYNSDTEFKIKHTLRRRLRHAIKGTIKKKSVHELLGCDIDFFREYIEKQFLKGMNWKNHGKWHIDHIKPCDSFDLSDKEQQKKCFHYSNLQPLWAKDNLKKSNII